MTDTFTWLLERITEERARAQGSGSWVAGEWKPWTNPGTTGGWSPARVIEECDLKAWLVREHHIFNTGAGFCCVCCSDVDHKGQARGVWPCFTLRILALPYAEHEGYNEDWRPDLV